MHRVYKKILTLGVLLCAALAALPTNAVVFHSDVRVQLSVGAPQTLSFTPVGEYYLREAPDLEVGTEELTITRTGGRPSVTIGDKTVTATSLTFLSKDYGGRSAYIRLKNAEYGVCTYLGNMTFDIMNGGVRAVNTLPIEQYLYGVVPHEMSTGFPTEALKAQAVCARGYVVARCSRYTGSRSYDILDTSKDQVYRGYASKNIRAIAAVDATTGQVLTYDGDIIEAFYSASNGGQTEKSGNVWENDLPYYTQADDPYDLDNPSSLEYTAFIPAVFNDDTRGKMQPSVLLMLMNGANAAAGETVELVSTVAVLPEAPRYDPPSRCYTLAQVILTVRRANGEEGQIPVTLSLDELDYGAEYENTLGAMKTGLYNLRMHGAEPGSLRIGGTEYPGWYLTTRRYGHGVGLSQRGAQERARAGQSYKEMLGFYYVDTAIKTSGAYESAPQLSSDTYRIKSWGVSNVEPGTQAQEFLQALSSKGTLTLINAKGKAKTEGTLCCGDFVRTVYDNESAFFDLPVVIFGDLDGDGSLGEGDIKALRDHLLHAQPLSGAYLAAADVNHDENVDTLDLLALVRHVLGGDTIRQRG